MKLRILNNAIYDDTGNIVGVVSEHADEEVRKTIEAGSDAIDAIRKFISNANNGRFRPKSSVREFERILEQNSIDYD